VGKSAVAGVEVTSSTNLSERGTSTLNVAKRAADIGGYSA